MDRMEQLIQVMRRQGRYHNTPGIQTGIVQDAHRIRCGGLLLKKGDYLLPEGTVLKRGDRTAICYCENAGRYIVLCKVVES